MNDILVPAALAVAVVLLDVAGLAAFMWLTPQPALEELSDELTVLNQTVHTQVKGDL